MMLRWGEGRVRGGGEERTRMISLCVLGNGKAKTAPQIAGLRGVWTASRAVILRLLIAGVFASLPKAFWLQFDHCRTPSPSNV